MFIWAPLFLSCKENVFLANKADKFGKPQILKGKYPKNSDFWSDTIKCMQLKCTDLFFGIEWKSYSLWQF